MTTYYANAFGRSVKIVIGQPTRTVATPITGAVNSVGQAVSTTGVLASTDSDSTTIPQGDIVQFSNLKADGQDSRIFSFDFESTRGSPQGGSSQKEKSYLTLYNLNQDTKDIINQPFVRVLIYLGYNEEVDLYYTGDVLSIDEFTNGIDTSYRLTLKDGGVDDKDATVGLEYDESMSVKDILTDLAKRFPTSSTGNVNLDFLKNKFVIGGLTVVGNLGLNFDQLCKAFGVSYFKYNGKIHLQPYKLINGSVDYLNIASVYNTYEIQEKSVKSLSAVSQNTFKSSSDSNVKRAVQLTTFLAPIELGQFFTITKDVDETLAGTYKVTTLKIHASGRGNQWDVTVRGEPM